MSPIAVAERAEAAGFASVAGVVRAWAEEPVGELAATLDAFADVHALAALRVPRGSSEHLRIASALRRAAALLREAA